MATAKKPGAKPKPPVRPKPIWYGSETDGPPPRPVDAPSGPTYQYKQITVPDPITKGKTVKLWMTTRPPQGLGDPGQIPLATGKPSADTTLPHTYPTLNAPGLRSQLTSTKKGPNMARPITPKPAVSAKRPTPTPAPPPRPPYPAQPKGQKLPPTVAGKPGGLRMGWDTTPLKSPPPTPKAVRTSSAKKK